MAPWCLLAQRERIAWSLAASHSLHEASLRLLSTARRARSHHFHSGFVEAKKVRNC